MVQLCPTSANPGLGIVHGHLYWLVHVLLQNGLQHVIVLVLHTAGKITGLVIVLAFIPRTTISTHHSYAINGHNVIEVGLQASPLTRRVVQYLDSNATVPTITYIRAARYHSCIETWFIAFMDLTLRT